MRREAEAQMHERPDLLPWMRREIIRRGGGDSYRAKQKPVAPMRVGNIPDVVDRVLQLTQEQMALELCGASGSFDARRARAAVVFNVHASVQCAASRFYPCRGGSLTLRSSPLRATPEQAH
jgi:hypothetical protein